MRYPSPIPLASSTASALLVENAKVKQTAADAKKNPLRIDPTRTTLIRRRFMTAMRKRFRALRAELIQFVSSIDALALDERTPLVIMAQPREFAFHTDAAKLTAFNDWFRQQVDAKILSPSPGIRADQPWTSQFVESAYRRGQLNAFLAARQLDLELSVEEGLIGDQSIEDFMRTGFGAPETMSKVQLLATRSFEQLKGVTSAMGADMNRIMAQAIADGLGAEETARRLTGSLDSLTRSRAMALARTEIIHAHAEGQLDSFERLGIKELGLKAEWSTAGDDHVCPLCQPREGKVYTIAQARGLIPLHPNCRCSWIPWTP